MTNISLQYSTSVQHDGLPLCRSSRGVAFPCFRQPKFRSIVGSSWNHVCLQHYCHSKSTCTGTTLARTHLSQPSNIVPEVSDDSLPAVNFWQASGQCMQKTFPCTRPVKTQASALWRQVSNEKQDSVTPNWAKARTTS